MREQYITSPSKHHVSSQDCDDACVWDMSSMGSVGPKHPTYGMFGAHRTHYRVRHVDSCSNGVGYVSDTEKSKEE